MATNRSVATSGTGSNLAYGVDGAFLLTQTLTAGTYWARTNTDGLNGNDESYQGKVDYSADRYGASVEYLSVGANFDPQVGIPAARRLQPVVRASSASARARTMLIPSVRKFTWTVSAEYVENGDGTVDARVSAGHFDTEFASSDKFSIDVTHDYEFLRVPFTPSGSPAPIAVGGYTFSDVTVAYDFGAQRRASGTIKLQLGDYYDGTIRSVTFGPGNSFSSARVAISQRLALEPTFSITRIERAAGSFTTRLARARRGLRLLAADVRERAAAVQLRRPRLQHQPALPLGVRAGERDLPRLHRRARHHRPLRAADHRARAQEPGVRGEDQSAVPVLTDTLYNLAIYVSGRRRRT